MFNNQIHSFHLEVGNECQNVARPHFLYSWILIINLHTISCPLTALKINFNKYQYSKTMFLNNLCRVPGSRLIVDVPFLWSVFSLLNASKPQIVTCYTQVWVYLFTEQGSQDTSAAALSKRILPQNRKSCLRVNRPLLTPLFFTHGNHPPHPATLCCCQWF